MNKTKLIGIVVILTITILILGACNEETNTDDKDYENSITFYDLNINTEGEGTTNPSSGTYEYEEYSSAEIKAIPKDGWKFIKWEGDISSYSENNKESSVYMDKNKSITAIFEEKLIGHKDKPADINETVVINTDKHYSYNKLNFEITLINYIKGDKAWDIINEATNIVDKPNSNEEYYLLQFTIDVIEVDEEPFSVNSFDIEAMSSNNDIYDDYASDIGLERTDLNGGALSTDIYSNGTTTGWVYILVKKDDNPCFTFLRNHNIAWFQIK